MKLNNSEIFINGPDGKLEAKYVQSKRENAPLAVVLHPHPEYGGTMNNKVIYHAYHTFLKNGFQFVVLILEALEKVKANLIMV